MTLLIDIGDIDHDCVDDALDHLCKASSEAGGTMWDSHPSPMVRQVVELFTQRGLARSAELTRELSAWLAGERHRPELERPTRPAGAMERWSKAELDVVRSYLEALRPADMSLDDWLMVVDYLSQRYLPANDLRTEAEWLSTRCALMGRVEAAMGELPEGEAEGVLNHLPAPDDVEQLGLTREMRAVLEFGRVHACERIVGLSDQQRHRLRNIVVDHQQALYLGDKARGAESLQSKLLDAEGLLNRDWRRIAVTEATEMLGQGFIASQAPGARVKRVEQYRGACSYCRSIDGRVMTVAAPDAPDKDGETEVWAGKTNADRSSAPRRRQGDQLVEREPGERWWVPAGAVHANCRGRWIAASSASRDPTFDAWLSKMKERRG